MTQHGQSESISTEVRVPLRKRAADAVELLTVALRGRRPTWDEVGRVIAVLKALRNLDEFPLMWSCPRCGAEVWSPCVKRNGDVFTHKFRSDLAFHAPRMNLGIAGCNSLMVECWRVDLDNLGASYVSRAAGWIRRSRAVKHLMRLEAGGQI